MAKKVRMSDIANALGVSNVTVSKALSNKDGVSEELRLKIKKLANEMGYQYLTDENTSSSKHIGIIIAQRYIDSAYSFYWNLYKYIVEYLKQYKSYGILEIIPLEYEKDLIVPEILNDHQLYGYMVLGEMNEDYLKILVESNRKIVFADFSNNDLLAASVITNNYYDTYKITEYLIKKGHRNIGFVGSINMKNNIYDRYFGYCKAMIKNGYSIKDEWIIEDRKEDLSFLTSFQLPVSLPSAFVCNCDETAYHFIQYLKQKGYRIPEDVSVVGYYNFVFSKMCNPELTTVNVDLSAMAKKAVDSIINSRDDLLTIVINGTIVERESVKDIK